MIRTIIGGLVGGIVIFVIGMIFWATPLANIAVSGTDAQSAANVQAVLAEALTVHGTGVYMVPSPDTSAGTTLYGKGPVALVQFNTSGFPANGSDTMVPGILLALATGMLIAAALRGTAGALTDFRSRLQAVLCCSAAAVLWLHIGQPIFNHAPWGYYLYLAFSDFLSLAAAGTVIARWFVEGRPQP